MDKEERSGLGYSGEVTLRQKLGRATLSSRTIYNAGCMPLFKFIAKALTGEFSSAQLPAKIQLFGMHMTGGEPDEDPDEAVNMSKHNSQKWLFQENRAVSPCVSMSTTGTIETNESSNVATVSFVFRIPYELIVDDVYKMALFQKNGSAEHGSDTMCAYVGLTNDDKTA